MERTSPVIIFRRSEAAHAVPSPIGSLAESEWRRRWWFETPTRTMGMQLSSVEVTFYEYRLMNVTSWAITSITWPITMLVLHPLITMLVLHPSIPSPLWQVLVKLKGSCPRDHSFLCIEILSAMALWLRQVCVSCSRVTVFLMAYPKDQWLTISNQISVNFGSV